MDKRSYLSLSYVAVVCLMYELKPKLIDLICILPTLFPQRFMIEEAQKIDNSYACSVPLPIDNSQKNQ